jgi:hypothetical protein
MEFVLGSIAVSLAALFGYFAYRIVRYRSIAGARFGAVVQRVVGETTARLEPGIPVILGVYQLQGQGSSGGALGMEVRMPSSSEDGPNTYTFSMTEAVAFVELLQHAMRK